MKIHRISFLQFPLALLCIGYLSSITSQATCQTAPGGSEPATASEPLRTAVDRPIDIKNIRLDLRVDLAHKTVDAEASLQVKSMRPIKTISLDAVGFEVKAVTLATDHAEPKPARFDHDGKKLVVQLDSPWPTGREGALRINYRVQDPKDGLHFFAPSKTESETPLEMWSQGEPSSNRYWIPCIDEPRQRQTTEIIATVPQGFDAISNGKLIERRENPDTKTVTFDWKQDKPHPSYLVTLVVGQFDVVREEWDGIPVVYYVPKGRKDEVARSFGRTREMLSHFSKLFGVHYPWDKYAQVVAYQFGGGMENTSATTLGEFALKDERSMLDSTPDWLISHELAHQWWGDLLTCRDWAHLWLNEGFASYAEALWGEHQGGSDEYAYSMFGKAAGAIDGGKTRPVVDRRYPSPGSMFDGRAYPKGAWILHMLRQRLGDDAFWKSIQRYANEHRLQGVETADFRRTVERETGRDLERFFYDWTERPGNPVVEVTTEYMPDSQRARITVKQTQDSEPFEFPLAVVFHKTGQAGREPITIDITKKEQSLEVPLSELPAFVDIDPNQAVLMQLKETKGIEMWRAQLLDSPSVACRIRAARHLATDKSDANRELLARALANEKYYGVQVEIATALGTSGASISRDALIKGMKHADARVRKACVENLTNFRNDDIAATAVRELLHKGDPSYAVEGASMSTYAKQGHNDAVAIIAPWLSKPSYNDVLRGAALTALGKSKDLAALDVLLDWAQPGKPRTARTSAINALSTLVQGTNPSEAKRQEVIKALTSALESGNAFLRFNVLSSLSALGPSAKAALPALEKMSRDEPNEALRNAAKHAADAIRPKATDSKGSPDANQLREELERLKREDAALRAKLKKLEKSTKKKRE
jgi:aminopeptidase N